LKNIYDRLRNAIRNSFADQCVTRKQQPDLAGHHGFLRRLHLLAGNSLATASEMLRPQLSLGVRLLALDSQKRVMLVRHSYVPGYYLPGGGVEIEETAVEAAMREAREEAGLILNEQPQLFNIYRSLKPGRRDHILLYVSRKVAIGTERKASFPEILESAFYPAEALPENTTAATRARIDEVLHGKPRSYTW